MSQYMLSLYAPEVAGSSGRFTSEEIQWEAIDVGV